MSHTRLTHISMHLDGDPRDVRLDQYDIGHGLVLRLGNAADLILDQASPELLFRIAGLFADAATVQRVKQIRQVA